MYNLNMEVRDKKHIITVGGMLGSGKSSTAKLVAKHLGYQHYSAGDVMRQIGKEQGIEDIRTFNLASEGKKDFDHQVDERTKLIGETEDRLVFDGHMAWRFIPQSFRVFLHLDENLAAARILNSMDEFRRASEHISGDTNEYASLLRERKASNIRRYSELYQTNPYVEKHYDFVVDTSQHDLNEVSNMIIEAYYEWFAGTR